MCKSVRCCKFPWAIFHAVDVMAQSERHVEDVERIKRRNTWVVSTIGSVLRRWALTFHLLGVCAQISVQSRISFYVSSFVWCEFILRQNWCTGNFKSMRQVDVLSQAIFCSWSFHHLSISDREGGRAAAVAIHRGGFASYYAFRSYKLSKNKFASPQLRTIVYPVMWPKGVLLLNDMLNYARFRVFGTRTACKKQADFSKFEPIMLQKRIVCHSMNKRYYCDAENSSSFMKVYDTALTVCLKIALFLFAANMTRHNTCRNSRPRI